MESPAARYIPQKSKKRVFPGGGSSSCMDPDVIEISPPTPSTRRSSNSNSRKQKSVMVPEIIDVDMDEDCGDVMLINGEVDRKKKGKGILVNGSKELGNAAKVGSMDGVQSSKKTSAPASQNVVDLDGSIGDPYHYGEDDYMDMFLDDYVHDDDYSILQSHFDNIDLPTGVEAPIPWLPGHAQFGNMPDIGSGSTATSLQNPFCSAGSPSVVGSSLYSWIPGPAELSQGLIPSGSFGSQFHLNSGRHVHGVDLSPLSSWPFAKQSKNETLSGVFNNSSFVSPQVEKVNVSSDLKSFKAWHQRSSPRSKRKHSVSGDASYHSSHDKLGGVKLSAVAQPFNYPHSTKYQVGNGSFFPDLPGPMETFNSHEGNTSISKGKAYHSFLKKQPYVNASVYSGFYAPFEDVHGLPKDDTYAPGIQDPAVSEKNSTDAPSQSSSSGDILAKYQLFKKFDTVEDHSDHHYTRNGSSSKQPSKNWAKKIQDEWKILEKDLPDTIFVRVYESRMDLLRAVIIGAEATPYHDGLFFFDVFFPSSYPNVPPHVYYHSGGLRINPNLYNCGKVCLSLLNTWSGGKKEKWLPGVSTMLQVLVSIQGLILNAKPYFNEPGYAHSSGSPAGEKSALQYNENTFLLSLKTMTYSLRKPPKYFEDFVAGHFCKHGNDILVACKAYIEGAQVGCLVRGGVQDVDEGDKSSSQGFKDSVTAYISTLAKAFAKVGAKDTDKFLHLARTRSTQVPLVPTASNFYGPWRT